MDPHTKRTIVARTASELRALIGKWFEVNYVRQVWNAHLTPATALIEIHYADSNGVIVREQIIHTNADVLREVIAGCGAREQSGLFGGER